MDSAPRESFSLHMFACYDRGFFMHDIYVRHNGRRKRVRKNLRSAWS